jgi:Icc-related predicted phosphoesterase
MHLLYASDLHGSPLHYAGLSRLAARLKPDALLLGGDLFSNSAPISEAPAAQRREAETTFASWCASQRAPVYWIAGNHDWHHTVTPPPAAGTFVHGRCVPLGDWDLVGFSLCSPTPYWLIDQERRERFSSRREPRGRCWMSGGATPVPVEHADDWLEDRPTLLEELERLPEPRSWRRAILMAHDPPYDTGLDLRWGPFPVGSSDVRHFIEARKPALSLHGHIHEAPLLTQRVMHRVGSTCGFNAGRVGGGIRALWIDPDRPEEAKLFGPEAV